VRQLKRVEELELAEKLKTEGFNKLERIIESERLKKKEYFKKILNGSDDIMLKEVREQKRLLNEISKMEKGNCQKMLTIRK
jgi:hypothetical protein